MSGKLVGGRYRLGESLGQGGMGEVWSATDDVLGRQVAIKLLLPYRSDEMAADRFRIEARAAARLSHPNVVAVYDFGTHEGHLYLVMELVQGHSLAQELTAHGLMGPQRVVGIAAQTAAGLAAAHHEGVVHRDIKPGNLLLTDEGIVKIADFGIARFSGEAAEGLTSTGQIVGTSYYLAPERAQGRPATPASDVYSLGCVLYQLVTGQPPFTADTPAGVAYQHVDTLPVPPGDRLPALTGAFQDYLLRMLAKDADQRPTAEEIAGWSSAATPPVTRPGYSGLAERSTTISLAGSSFPPAATGQRSSRTKALLGAVGAVAVGTAVVAGLVINDGREQAPVQSNLAPATTPIGKDAPLSPGTTPTLTRPVPTPTRPRSATDWVTPVHVSTRPSTTHKATVKAPGKPAQPPGKQPETKKHTKHKPHRH